MGFWSFFLVFVHLYLTGHGYAHVSKSNENTGLLPVSMESFNETSLSSVYLRRRVQRRGDRCHPIQTAATTTTTSATTITAPTTTSTTNNTSESLASATSSSSTVTTTSSTSSTTTTDQVTTTTSASTTPTITSESTITTTTTTTTTPATTTSSSTTTTSAQVTAVNFSLTGSGSGTAADGLLFGTGAYADQTTVLAAVGETLQNTVFTLQPVTDILTIGGETVCGSFTDPQDPITKLFTCSDPDSYTGYVVCSPAIVGQSLQCSIAYGTDPNMFQVNPFINLRFSHYLLELSSVPADSDDLAIQLIVAEV